MSDTPAPTTPASMTEWGVKMKQRRRQAEERAKTAETERDAARKEASELKARIDGDPFRAENEALKAQIRTDKHRAKFEAKAKEAGLRPEAIEDAWNLSGYKSDSDTIDEAKIDSTLAEQKTKRPYLFGEPATTATEQPVPGPGKGQGGTVTSGNNGNIKVTRKQLMDMTWKKANRAIISAGKFEVVD